RRPSGIRTRLPRAFDPEGIARTWGILGEENLDRRHFSGCHHQIIGKIYRQRLTVVIVQEFFIQSSADSLRKPAGNLPLNEHRVKWAADVIGEKITLDVDPAGFSINPDQGNMDAIGKNHVIGKEPAFSAQTWLVLTAQAGCGSDSPRDLRESHGW